MSATDPPRRGSRAWWSGVVPVPTRRLGVVTLAVAAVVALVPIDLSILVPVVLLAVVVTVDRLRTPAPWKVPVRRQLPAVLPLDGQGEITWIVGSPAGRTVQVAIADELPPSLGAIRRRASLRVPAGGQARASSELRPSRRGTFRPTDVTVRVTGPLGLVHRQADRPLPGQVQVHPSFRSREQAELRLRRARVLTEGQRATRRRGEGTEFEALRDYVHGDAFRHVDWAATARAGRPIVRTHRSERNQQVLVLLDAGRVMAGAVDGVPRLDHGMDATLALATVATRLGDRVGMVAFGARTRAVVPPRRDTDQLRRLSTAMHALEPELAESGYRDAFRTTLGRFHRRALLVLITELAAEVVQETLIPALPLVLRDHAVIVASVRDPQVARWRDGDASTVGEAYRAAAAAGLLTERERTAALLRRHGVVVVDAIPGDLAGAVVDAYLDVKLGGQL